jgi:hypothetical protein
MRLYQKEVTPPQSSLGMESNASKSLHPATFSSGNRSGCQRQGATMIA